MIIIENPSRFYPENSPPPPQLKIVLCLCICLSLISLSLSLSPTHTHTVRKSYQARRKRNKDLEAATPAHRLTQGVFFCPVPTRSCALVTFKSYLSKPSHPTSSSLKTLRHWQNKDVRTLLALLSTNIITHV